jgi:peptidyl-prolyl cis-trans isomerase A (cyclophilin A)
MRLLLALAWLVTGAVMAQPPAQPSAGLSAEPQVRVVTNLGSFVIQLNRARAPLTVRNFLMYVHEGFYEGTIFHRIVQGFVAQAGGYTTDLQPKKTTHAVVNESGNGLTNRRGTVGMARTGDPHSANAQFYINLVDNPDLDPKPTRWGYAVFGTVIDGMDVVDEIGHRPTGAAGPFDRNVPVDPIVIQRIDIIRE